jgi:hypothetical protein
MMKPQHAMKEIFIISLLLPYLSLLTSTYFANSLSYVFTEPDIQRLFTFQLPNPTSSYTAYVILKNLSKSKVLCNISYHISFCAVSTSRPLVQTSNWRATPCWLCALTYSTHLQLSHLETVPSNLNLKMHHAVMTRVPFNLYYLMLMLFWS